MRAKGKAYSAPQHRLGPKLEEKPPVSILGKEERAICVAQVVAGAALSPTMRAKNILVCFSQGPGDVASP